MENAILGHSFISTALTHGFVQHLDIQIIKRTWHSMSALPQNMVVNDGRGDIFMAQQGLYGPDVSASLQKMSGETVPEGMCAYLFCQSCFTSSYLDCLVNYTGVNMMSPYFTA